LSRFTHLNPPFHCEACGQEIPPLSGSCRNHCPYCLISKHVDIHPGDRANPCQGLMDAVDYELSGKKGLVLIFRCRRCGELGRNIAAHEAPEAPDDYDRILGLKQTST
jgi:predicted RNA-binding Zn-ribbon protein involved in translation (DUF1610 family)